MYSMLNGDLTQEGEASVTKALSGNLGTRMKKRVATQAAVKKSSHCPTLKDVPSRHMISRCSGQSNCVKYASHEAHSDIHS